tara:strand:- start:20014 stop:21669 length:1656 start_codon:yes stop_codon:yes gene_type:complete
MKKSIKLISDFNLDTYYNFLNQKINNKKYKLIKPNFGLFFDSCFGVINSKNKNHIIFVWTTISGVIKSFNSLINNENINLKKLQKEVDEYINIIKQLSTKTEYLIINSWSLPENVRGKYLNDYTDDMGLSKNINLINLKISNELKKQKNIIFLNMNFWIKNYNSDYNPKLWYAAKIPYSQKVFENAANELNKIIHAFEGKNKKLIIVDLDNTLWGGVLGDLGWKKINLGGHNIEGEAFRDFQTNLKSFKNRGIQLAICSKNEEKNALEALEKNPNMILKKKDFATWRINWEDKAKNISEIMTELNLPNDAAVFIDDSISERERVKSSLKGIVVPDWPKDPCYYVSKLLSLDGLSVQHLTYEDKNRTKFYQDEKIRKKNKEKFISHEKWLSTLKTKVFFEKGNEKNKKRILQLINKTNQMNLTTRRISESTLDKLINSKNSYLFSCKVKDKFGDMGLVGVLSFAVYSNKIEIIDFILSCRAFGRSIEKLMLFKVIKNFKNKNIDKIVFKYLKTQKNKPCLDFLKNNLEKEKNNVFVHRKNTKFVPPKFVKII